MNVCDVFADELLSLLKTMTGQLIHSQLRSESSRFLLQNNSGTGTELNGTAHLRFDLANGRAQMESCLNPT